MRVVFVGTGAIGVPALRALLKSGHEVVAVVTQPDKPVGRNQRVEAPPIKQALSGLAIPVFQPARIKQETSVEQIRGCDPDVLVVMAYGQILPGSLLAVPKAACINLHASLLPKWRGAAPIQGAIAAGDNQTGLTVMYVDEGLDTGDILLQEPIEISAGDTGGTVHDRLAQMAPDAMLKALELIQLGKAPRIPQDSSQATYAPKLDRESGRINWTEPAESIERKIRAFNPWPGSFTKLRSESSGGRKLKVFSATITTHAGEPGKILRRDQELVIAGGTQALSLTEVQLEGRKRMSAADFIRGNQWIETAETA
jgi:methionyl-tRNA formyltransferase